MNVKIGIWKKSCQIVENEYHQVFDKLRYVENYSACSRKISDLSNARATMLGQKYAQERSYIWISLWEMVRCEWDVIEF